MFDKNFEYAIEIALEHEGGYVNDPTDPGGETKYGISKRTYPRVNIRSLTLDDAKQIYYDDFWVKGGYNRIDHKEMAEKVFNAGINMGVKRGNKILQKSCNHFGKRLVVDGIIGRNTIRIVNSINGSELRDIYKFEMYTFYINLIKRKPAMIKYKNGWRRRAFD